MWLGYFPGLVQIDSLVSLGVITHDPYNVSYNSVLLDITMTDTANRGFVYSKQELKTRNKKGTSTVDKDDMICIDTVDNEQSTVTIPKKLEKRLQIHLQ